jgi:hypothetical protein
MDHRPCERKCAACGKSKHHSRFASRQRRTPNSTVWEFDPTCRDCQQKQRNEKKNADRPLAIIKQRAAQAAHKAGTPAEFFMTQMNYTALVPLLRGLMSDEGLCLVCGHRFENERDIQIEHIEPPRDAHDWARLHARNLRLCCGSCNKTKGRKPFLQWLDDEEGARLSNLTSQEEPASLLPRPAPQPDKQGSFDLDFENGYHV